MPGRSANLNELLTSIPTMKNDQRTSGTIIGLWMVAKRPQISIIEKELATLTEPKTRTIFGFLAGYLWQLTLIMAPE